jgi:hypothetical protein
MNRPPVTDFMLGHRATVWFVTGAAGVSALAAAEREASWLVPLAALATRNMCAGARRRVATWRNWTEAWQEMAAPELPERTPSSAGSAPPAVRTGTAQLPMTHKSRRVPRSALILAWLLLLAWFTVRRDETQTPFDGVLALCLIALSCRGALAAIASAVAALRRRAHAPAAETPARRASEPVQDDIVSQCLPVPRTPVRAANFAALMPDYACELLARSRDAHSSATPHPSTESEQCP